MTHSIKINGDTISIEMGCFHPLQKGATTEGVGCNGNCHECKYGKAVMTIEDFLKLQDIIK